MRAIACIGAVTGLLFVVASPTAPAAEERIEGTVVSTVMTACGMTPGTCEGSLVLDTKGKDGQVTVTVPNGTQIKKDDGHVFLPGLKGSQVAIAYGSDNGARVAKLIEVRPAKP